MKNIILIFTLLIGFAMAQDIDVYLSMLKNGQIEQVQQSLADLETQYPNNDGVQFLKILTVVNGDLAQELFEDFIQRYPNSNYTDDAEIKIGEYLYARGLYSQAGNRLRYIPLKYPDTEHLGRAVSLLTKSYQATGEQDTLEYYLSLYDKQFGNTNFDEIITMSEKLVESETVEIANIEDSPAIVPNENATIVQAQKFRPWVIQVGAFRAESNANRVKGRIERSGDFEVVVVKTYDDGLTIYAVQIVRYDSKIEAERVGRTISESLGVDYRVYYRP
ncbi:outer membrane protein assembly factor BamD [Candidatus Neomarinimicrobiota bacterium]